MGSLWRVQGVALRDKVRSCEICKSLHVEPLLRIERSQICSFGHVTRMSKERLERHILLATPASWRGYISDLPWSRLGLSCGVIRTIWDTWKQCGISSPRAAAPATLLRKKKRVWKSLNVLLSQIMTAATTAFNSEWGQQCFFVSFADYQPLLSRMWHAQLRSLAVYSLSPSLVLCFLCR